MKRLFIVGNDTFTVQAMRFALRYSSGVNLFGVIDGQGSVRQAVREAQPDVVVVDGLEDATVGPARVREIREEAPHATIMLLTTPLGDEALSEVLDAGAMVCLSRGLRLQDSDQAAAEHAGNGYAALPAGNGNGNGNGKANGNGQGRFVPGAHLPATNGANGHHAMNGNGHAAAAAQSAMGNGRAGEAQACPLTRRELEILRAVTEGHTNARIGRDLWVTEQTVKFHLSNIYRKLGVSNRTEASRYALVNDLFGARQAAGNGAGELGAQDFGVRSLAARADLHG
jgi:DNA-binding NarL/FixJ family response regulator